MKLVFLDVDGVLNRRGTKERFLGFLGLDAVLVKRFQDWQKTNDVHLVLSSTWRQDDRFVAHLKDNGFSFVGYTDNDGGTRGSQIEAWLDKNSGLANVSHFVVLDDINYGMSPMGRYLVQTSDLHGVQDKHLRKMNKLLDIQPQV